MIHLALYLLLQAKPAKTALPGDTVVLSNSGLIVTDSGKCRYAFMYDEKANSCYVNITFETGGQSVACTLIEPVDSSGQQHMRCSYTPKSESDGGRR